MARILKMPPVVVKKSRPWDSKSRAMVLKLHDAGWTDAQIGRSVLRTEKSVKIELAKLLYYRTQREKAGRQATKKKPEVYADRSPGIGILAEAEEALKHRLHRIGPLLYLDDRPCTVQRLMVEYSNSLVAQGKNPVCRATECLL